MIYITFHADSFFKLAEDLEDYSFLEGQENAKDKTVSHEVVKEENKT